MPRSASIAFYRRDSNPATDAPAFHLKPREAQLRAEHGYVSWIGPDAVQECDREEKSALEQFAGWTIIAELQHCALNRGRAGQFTIGYPIPYAYEGSMKPMRVAVVNSPYEPL